MSIKLREIGVRYTRLDLTTSIIRCSDEKDYADVVKKIGDFERYCLVAFGQSVLSGEYIVNPDGVKAEVRLLKDILQISLDPAEEDVKKIAVTKRITDHNQWICFMLNEYMEHITDTESRMETYDYALYGKSNNIEYPQNAKYAENYLMILRIARIDCFFEYRAHYVRQLLQFREYLQNAVETNRQIVLLNEILKDKCTLLLKKLVPYANNEARYTVDNVPVKFDPAAESTKYLMLYDEHFNLYSKQGYAKEARIQKLERKLFREPSELQFGEMMLLLKYYKDYNTLPKKHVDKVVELFEEKASRFDAKGVEIGLDTFCIDSLRHYVKNCKLSFDMKQSDFTIEKLEASINDIKELQIRTGINNFYPYRKALSYLLKIVKGEIQVIYNADKVKELLAEYDANLRDSIDWCDERSYFPINLPYDECLIKVPNWEGKVYTPSSYCRAVYYQNERNNYQELHLETVMANNRLEMLREHANVEALRDEYKNAIGKNLETMSIFSAVIAFLFGCVNFLTLTGRIEGFSSMELLFDTAIWGTVLLLFSNMILVWTMSKGDTWSDFIGKLRGKLFVGSSVIYLVVIICGLIFCISSMKPKENPKKDQSMQQQEQVEENPSQSINLQNSNSKSTMLIQGGK